MACQIAGQNARGEVPRVLTAHPYNLLLQRCAFHAKGESNAGNGLPPVHLDEGGTAADPRYHIAENAFSRTTQSSNHQSLSANLER